MVSTPLASHSGFSGRRLFPSVSTTDSLALLDGPITLVHAAEAVSQAMNGARAIPIDAIATERETMGPSAPTPAAELDILALPVLRDVIEDLLGATRFTLGADSIALFWTDATTGAMAPRLVAGADLVGSLPIGSLNPLPVSGAIEIDPSVLDHVANAWIRPIGEAGALLVAWRRPHDLDATACGTIELAATLIAASLDHARTETLDPSLWRYLVSTLDATGEGIVARDATGCLIHMNAAAREMLGIDPNASANQLNDPALIPSLDLRDQWGQSLDPTMLPSAKLRIGKPAPDLMVSARSAIDGYRRWMLLHAISVANARGRNEVVITVLRDFATIQRHDESHWLRSTVSEHLHVRPIDMRAIERDIADYLDGGCAIVLTGQSVRLARAPQHHARRSRSGREPADGDDAAVELSLACGHLNRHESVTLTPGGHEPIQIPRHVVDIPIEGEGIVHGHMTCERAAGRPCFDREELELLSDLADTIGLALSVSRLRESLDAGQRLLVDIGQRLQDAEEAERRRVALSIHDGLAQVAASVCQQLEILAHRFAPSCDAESMELDRARALAQRTVQEARMLIAGLRPVTLDQHGLGQAVLEEVEGMRREGWSIRLFDGLSAARFASDVELEVFRVIQESLSNARKHAGRVEIDVLLEQRGACLHFEVCDHGAGFDAEAARRAATSGSHVGLGGMRERMTHIGGTLAIDSEQGRGTCVVGDAPV